MKRLGQPENERYWQTRLSALRHHPEPNLERGRVRVLAAAQRRLARSHTPQRGPVVLAVSVALSVMLVMVFMSSAMGALSITRVALTRTETLQTRDDATLSAPGTYAESPQAENGFMRYGTPVPGAVPEPPRSPAVASTVSNQTFR